MSLTIFPKAFNVGFSPQYQPAKSQVQGTADPPQVDSSGQVSGNPTELNTVKITAISIMLGYTGWQYQSSSLEQ